MKRIALIGLSTPVLYDYRFQAKKAFSDLSDSPNPILDSPFGLLLLYDELWFVCRSLCPNNMRHLPYVKFLDESSMLSKIENFSLDKLKKEEIELPNQYRNFYKEFFANYENNVKNMGINWGWRGIDNHTHAIKVCDLVTNACPTNLSNLLFDMSLVKILDKRNVELITNSFTQCWIESPDNPIIRSKLAELIIIENIPNYLSPQGPYHDCVEEVRNNQYLKDYRKWILSQPANLSEKELSDVKKEVEATIQKSQDEVFLKYLNPKTSYLSVGKTVVGTTIDLLTQGVFSSIYSVCENIVDYFTKGNNKWQGFIVSTRELKKNKN